MDTMNGASPNLYATYPLTADGNNRASAAGASRKGLWVQLYFGPQPIGQPNEFFGTSSNANISALKKEIQREYVELRNISPACLEVRNGGAVLEANAPIPETATYATPLQVFAFAAFAMKPPRHPEDAIGEDASSVDMRMAVSPAHSRENSSSVGGGGGTVLGDAIRDALRELIKPYLRKIQQAGFLQTAAGVHLTPFRVLQSKTSYLQKSKDPSTAILSAFDILQTLADWQFVYQQEGVGVLRAKLKNFQHQDRGEMTKSLPQDPNFIVLQALVLGGSKTVVQPAKKRRRAGNRVPTAEEVDERTTTGSVHESMPCRNKRRRCVVCKVETAHECSHEDCQQTAKVHHDGRVLLGVPICSEERNTCIEVHRK